MTKKRQENYFINIFRLVQASDKKIISSTSLDWCKPQTRKSFHQHVSKTGTRLTSGSSGLVEDLTEDAVFHLLHLPLLLLLLLVAPASTLEIQHENLYCELPFFKLLSNLLERHL